MDWESQHLQHPDWWHVEDIRWLGSPDRHDWDALFGDRPWVVEPPFESIDWPSNTLLAPGVVTSDLVYYPEPPSEYDRIPTSAHLAAAVHLPARAGAERPTKPVVVPAGTPVQIAGHCLYRTTRPEDLAMYTWVLPDGQELSADPCQPGRPSLLIYEILPALVVPSWSPLATIEAGSDLVRRAFELASDALHVRFWSFSVIARENAALQTRMHSEPADHGRKR